MNIKIKKIAILLPIMMLIMVCGVGAQSFPSFPMAFWGNVKLDGVSVSVGYVINAYYGSELGGSVVINEKGVYGYPDPFKQKLIVKEGSGSITFKLSHNGVDINATPINYSVFVAGDTINKDFNFITIFTPTPTPTPTTIYGGGGGGGGYYYATPTPTPTPTPTGIVAGAFIGPVSIPTLPANPTKADYENLLSALIQQLAYLRSLLAGQQGIVAGATAGYQFTHNLQLGDSGEDVRQVQIFLKAQGTEIYPEGLVTGYFGSLTQKAVQRFQEKYGIAKPGDPGYGYVGPKTRMKINSLQGL